MSHGIRSGKEEEEREGEEEEEEEPYLPSTIIETKEKYYRFKSARTGIKFYPFLYGILGEGNLTLADEDSIILEIKSRQLGAGSSIITSFILVRNRYVYILGMDISVPGTRTTSLYSLDLFAEDKTPRPYFTFQGNMPSVAIKFVSDEKIIYADRNKNLIVFDIPSRSDEILFSFDRFANVQRGDQYHMYQEKNNFYFLQEGNFPTKDIPIRCISNEDGSVLVFMTTAGPKDDDIGIFIINTRDPRNSWKMLFSPLLTNRYDVFRLLINILINGDKLYVITEYSAAAFDLFSKRMFFRAEANMEEHRIGEGERIIEVFRTSAGNVYMRLEFREKELLQIGETDGTTTLVPGKETKKIIPESSFDVAGIGRFDKSLLKRFGAGDLDIRTVSRSMRIGRETIRLNLEIFLNYFDANKVIKLIPNLRRLFNLEKEALNGPSQYGVVKDLLLSLNMDPSDSLIRFLIKYCINRNPSYFADSKEELVNLIKMNL